MSQTDNNTPPPSSLAAEALQERQADLAEAQQQLQAMQQERAEEEQKMQEEHDRAEEATRQRQQQEAQQTQQAAIQPQQQPAGDLFAVLGMNPPQQQGELIRPYQQQAQEPQQGAPPYQQQLQMGYQLQLPGSAPQTPMQAPRERVFAPQTAIHIPRGSLQGIAHRAAPAIQQTPITYQQNQPPFRMMQQAPPMGMSPLDGCSAWQSPANQAFLSMQPSYAMTMQPGGLGAYGQPSQNLIYAQTQARMQDLQAAQRASVEAAFQQRFSSMQNAPYTPAQLCLPSYQPPSQAQQTGEPSIQIEGRRVSIASVVRALVDSSMMSQPGFVQQAPQEAQPAPQPAYLQQQQAPPQQQQPVQQPQGAVAAQAGGVEAAVPAVAGNAGGGQGGAPGGGQGGGQRPPAPPPPPQLPIQQAPAYVAPQPQAQPQANQMQSQALPRRTNVSIATAEKAPKLKSREAFQNWKVTFQTFCSQLTVGYLLVQPPTYLPPLPDRIIPGMDRFVAFEPTSNQLPLEMQDAVENEKAALYFVYQALALATEGVSMASAAVMAVPSPNAFAAWTNLLQIMEPHTAASRQILMTQFQGLKQSPTESVEQYVARTRQLIDHISIEALNIDESFRVNQFVNGLRNYPQSRRDQLLLAPTLEVAIQQTLHFEMSDKVRNAVSSSSHSSRGDASAYAANAGGPDKSKSICRACNKVGHWAGDPQCKGEKKGSGKENQKKGSKPYSEKDKDAKKAAKAEKRKLKCTHCLKRNHAVEDCRAKIAGEPPAKKKKGANSAEAQESYAGPSMAGGYTAQARERATAASSSADDGQPLPFILDSGANRHMLHPKMKGAIKDWKRTSLSIDTAGGNVLENPIEGTAVLYPVGGTKPIVLSKALQHDGLTKNLLSCTAIFDDPNVERICLYRKKAVVEQADGTPILTLPVKDGLWQLDLRAIPDVSPPVVAHAASESAKKKKTAASPSKETAKLMHERLCHVHTRRLNELGSRHLLSDADELAKMEMHEKCEACELAKSHLLPFGESIPAQHQAKEPMDQIVADLCGPIDPPSLSDAQYMLGLIDSNSGFIWIIPIKSKDRAADAIIRWTARVKQETGLVPKRFLTDRGTEFMNKKLQQHWEKTGTMQVFSLPYTPPHHGKIERAWRSVCNYVRAMLNTAGAPQLLWAEAAVVVADTMNRTTISSNKQMVAMQALLKRETPPSISHLRVWGCDAYVTQDRRPVARFANRGTKLIYVGHASPIGYRFIDPRGAPENVIESRHAVFNETKFTAMADLNDQVVRGDFGEEHKQSDFWGSSVLHGDIEVAKLLSFGDQKEEPTSEQAAEPASSGGAPPKRRSPRKNIGVPEFKYGMIDPSREIASSATTMKLTAALEQKEDILTETLFGTAAAVEARAASRRLQAPSDEEQRRIRMIMEEQKHDPPADDDDEEEEEKKENNDDDLDVEELERSNAQRLAAMSEDERERFLAFQQVNKNSPFPQDRPHCNKAGELSTSHQCIFMKLRNGKRCKNRTRHGAFCQPHLEKVEGLRIKKSPIAGKGLFADKAFRKGDHITHYTGDISYDPDVDHGGSMYVYGLTDDVTIDAARSDTAPGRMMNDPKGTRPKKKPNAIWVTDNIRKQVRVKALKNIKPGDEILISYEKDYWRQMKEQAEAQKKLGVKRKQLIQREIERRDRAARPVAVALTAATAAPVDPLTYAEAMRSEHASEWTKAIAAEQASLKSKGVYEVVDSLPRGKRALDCKIVFKTKTDANGKNAKFKARIVVKGYKQVQGQDYHETSAPVMALKSLRVLTAIAAEGNLEFKMFDVKTAYLNADLKEVIYIKTPPGFVGPEKNKILKLLKSLYGLKQAGHNWRKKFDKELRAIGYVPSDASDPCVYVRRLSDGRLLRIGVYVDDGGYVFDKKDEKEMESDIDKLEKQFELTRLGDVSKILGIRVTRDRAAGTIFLDQKVYIAQLLHRFQFEASRGEETPEAKGESITEASFRKERMYQDEFVSPSSVSADGREKITMSNYSEVLGSLSWLAVATEPSIAHACNMAGREQSNPSLSSVIKLKRILRYLNHSGGTGLLYSRDATPKRELVAYSDADWAGDESDSLSTTGIVVKLSGAAVSWSSVKQTTVALSSTEAEYIATSEAAREIIWLRELCKHLGWEQKRGTKLYVDNTSAILLMQQLSGNTSARRKHIRVKYHYIQEQIKDGLITPQWVPSDQQEADIMTKPLTRSLFERLRDQITGHILLHCAEKSYEGKTNSIGGTKTRLTS